MRPMRATIIIAILILTAACSGAPGGSQDAASQAAQSAGQASEPAEASTGAAPSVAPPASEGGDPDVPDDAELQRRYDCIIAALAPPGGTEVGRENPGELDLGVFFESTEPFDALVAFYAEAIPAAGFEIVEERADFPGVHEWRFTSGEMFQPFISLSGQTSGSTVGMGLLGIPPEC
jgi:hypothetical protein